MRRGGIPSTGYSSVRRASASASATEQTNEEGAKGVQNNGRGRVRGKGQRRSRTHGRERKNNEGTTTTTTTTTTAKATNDRTTTTEGSQRRRSQRRNEVNDERNEVNDDERSERSHSAVNERTPHSHSLTHSQSLTPSHSLTHCTESSHTTNLLRIIPFEEMFKELGSRIERVLEIESVAVFSYCTPLSCTVSFT